MQQDMLAQGHALVAAEIGERSCTAILLAAERAARANGLGLWGVPYYVIQQAHNPAKVLAERGRFTLVEGKVLSVRESGATIYVNFGRRWSEDFTVTILKRNERTFAAAGIEPKKLAGRPIRVRGVDRGTRRSVDRSHPAGANRACRVKLTRELPSWPPEQETCGIAHARWLRPRCLRSRSPHVQTNLPAIARQPLPTRQSRRRFRRRHSANIPASLPPMAALTSSLSSKRYSRRPSTGWSRPQSGPDFKYKVTILNSPAINAFALSSGQLYVTRGLIALANDTSELASVLSHEMAHVLARHAAFREDQARQAVIFSRVATDLLGDPQMGMLALARSKIALASFSRAQEFEADGIGVGISARAGFDPYGAQRFLTSMGLNAQLRSHGPASGTASTDQRPPDFLSSHPSTPDRVKNARANARQYTGPGAGKRDKNEYLTLINGLVYGDDPSEGFVRGRRFLHPKLGFSFTAPESFILDNTAQAVFGVKDGGTQALRLDVVRAPARKC